jgi:transposase
MGLIHRLTVHSADIQDRDGGVLMFAGVNKQTYPRMKKLWVDSGYAGRCKTYLEEQLGWDIEVVRRPGEGNRGVWCLPGQEPPPRPKGFHVVKRRWVVERTFAWLGRYRRMSKDYEATIASSESYVYIAMISLMLNRLAPRKKSV